MFRLVVLSLICTQLAFTAEKEKPREDRTKMLGLPQQPPPPSSPTIHESRTLQYLLITSLFSLIFILTFISSSSSFFSPHSYSSSPPFSIQSHPKRSLIFTNPNQSIPTTPSSPEPPRLAYLITGSNGDTPRLIRLLFSIYHPRNHYLLHLDLTASQSQRDSLAIWIESHPVFGRHGPSRNVYVIGKADFAYTNGPSSISSTLHGASLLLRWSNYWHWFISLSASDYPLVTQDDLLHILSYVPKDFNFMNHSSDIGARESRRMKLITVDPGLYLTAKSEMFYATQKRELPNAFRLFTGSVSAILSRDFVEFCITGTNNLPRTVLMYLSNMPWSQATYFPTVVCNTAEFKKTIINHSLHFAAPKDPPKLEKRPLGSQDLNDMIQSGSAFASGFPVNDPVLDLIDKQLLNRKPENITPGGWCLGETNGDLCSVWGDSKILRPGLGARRLERRLVELLSNETLLSQQCVIQ